jgi:hypothetical protein
LQRAIAGALRNIAKPQDNQVNLSQTNPVLADREMEYPIGKEGVEEFPSMQKIAD